MEVRGVSSFLLPCGPNGHQAWMPTPLPTEPFHWPRTQCIIHSFIQQKLTRGRHFPRRQGQTKPLVKFQPHKHVVQRSEVARACPVLLYSSSPNLPTLCPLATALCEEAIPSLCSRPRTFQGRGAGGWRPYGSVPGPRGCFISAPHMRSCRHLDMRTVYT